MKKKTQNQQISQRWPNLTSLQGLLQAQRPSLPAAAAAMSDALSSLPAWHGALCSCPHHCTPGIAGTQQTPGDRWSRARGSGMEMLSPGLSSPCCLYKLVSDTSWEHCTSLAESGAAGSCPCQGTLTPFAPFSPFPRACARISATHACPGCRVPVGGEAEGLASRSGGFCCFVPASRSACSRSPAPMRRVLWQVNPLSLCRGCCNTHRWFVPGCAPLCWPLLLH